jgi:hypothetical protein
MIPIPGQRGAVPCWHGLVTRPRHGSGCAMAMSTLRPSASARFSKPNRVGLRWKRRPPAQGVSVPHPAPSRAIGSDGTTRRSLASRPLLPASASPAPRPSRQLPHCPLSAAQSSGDLPLSPCAPPPCDPLRSCPASSVPNPNPSSARRGSQGT